MAHNLYMTSKGAAYAGARELAWHRLGVTTKNAMTSEEAIKLAQLDYEVGIEKLYTSINGVSQWIDSHNVTYNKRNNHVFGVVGNRYEVIQNYEAFDFLDGIVKDKVAMFETAGALGMGETIFISVKLPNNIRIASLPDEEINNYLLFTSSHDGSGAIRVLFTPIRVVCNNTLSAALSTANGLNSWSIKHTKNARTRLQSVQNLFVRVNEEIEAMGYTFDRMVNFRMTEAQVDATIARIVLKDDEFVIDGERIQATKEISTNKKNIMYKLKSSIYKGVGQDIIDPSTAYGVFNGITSYVQNVKKYKNDEDHFKHANKSVLANKAYVELSKLMTDA